MEHLFFDSALCLKASSHSTDQTLCFSSSSSQLPQTPDALYPQQLPTRIFWGTNAAKDLVRSRTVSYQSKLAVLDRRLNRSTQSTMIDVG